MSFTITKEPLPAPYKDIAKETKQTGATNLKGTEEGGLIECYTMYMGHVVQPPSC